MLPKQYQEQLQHLLESKKQIVILAPHVDDELIGCSALFDANKVSLVVYFNELSTQRRKEAIALARSQYKQPYEVLFVDFDSIREDDKVYTFNQVFEKTLPEIENTVLVVPSIKDQHVHHKEINRFARPMPYEKWFYSVDMNHKPQLLSKEQRERKLEALLTAYPSQKQLFENDAKYHLFESILPSDLNTSITVRTQFEGVHCYPAAPEGVEFLRYPHRHVFHVEINVEVFHMDRDIEFILFKREIEALIKHRGKQLNFKSCEMIATELSTYVITKYEGRACKVTVSEDGENGATVEYTC
jgi:LmbE family N-acetylglucosaminyl deacetylase